MHAVIAGYKFKNTVLLKGMNISLTLSDDSRISGELKDISIASGVSLMDGVNQIMISLDSIQSISNSDIETYPSYYIGQVEQLCLDGIFVSIGDNISIKYKSLFNKYVRNTTIIGFTESKLAISDRVIELDKIIKVRKR